MTGCDEENGRRCNNGRKRLPMLNNFAGDLLRRERERELERERERERERDHDWIGDLTYDG